MNEYCVGMNLLYCSVVTALPNIEDSLKERAADYISDLLKRNSSDNGVDEDNTEALLLCISNLANIYDEIYVEQINDLLIAFSASSRLSIQCRVKLFKFINLYVLERVKIHDKKSVGQGVNIANWLFSLARLLWEIKDTRLAVTDEILTTVLLVVRLRSCFNLTDDAINQLMRLLQPMFSITNKGSEHIGPFIDLSIDLQIKLIVICHELSTTNNTNVELEKALNVAIEKLTTEQTREYLSSFQKSLMCNN